MGLCSNHRICAQPFSHTARWAWKESYGEVAKEEKSAVYVPVLISLYSRM